MWSKSRSRRGEASYTPQTDDETIQHITSDHISSKSTISTSSSKVINKKQQQEHNHISSSTYPNSSTKNSSKTAVSSNQSSKHKSSLSSHPMNSPTKLNFVPIIENSSNPPDLIGKIISLPGKNFENLTIDRKIAEGGFSTVYSVKKSLGNQKIQVFALKRMFVNSVSDLKTCTTEIQLMHSLLDKPNIIQYYSQVALLLTLSEFTTDTLQPNLELTRKVYLM